MSKLIGLAAIGAITLLTVTAHAADPQPGFWKISAKSERNGVTVGERSLDSCITADAAQSLTQIKLDQQFDPRNECKAVDEQRVGNSLSWRVQCTGPVPAESRALFVFDAPDHYSAVITTSLTIVRKTLSSTLRIEGRRVGDCPK